MPANVATYGKKGSFCTKRRQGILARLRAEDGFTMGEQLVAVVMLGLLGIAVAVGISVFTRTYTEIKDVSDTYSMLNIATTAVSDELRYATDIAQVEDFYIEELGTISEKNTGIAPLHGIYAFDSTRDNARIALVNVVGADGTGNIAVQSAVPPDVGESSTSRQPNAVPDSLLDETAVYSALLVPEAGISIQMSDLSYDAEEKVWTFVLNAYKNAVFEDGVVTSSDYEATTGEMKVAALN